MVTAWVSHPLLAAGRLSGTLALGTTRRPRFEPAELELVRTTCDQIAMALERRRLNLELENRASDLTQANRAKGAITVRVKVFLPRDEEPGKYMRPDSPSFGSSIHLIFGSSGFMRFAGDYRRCADSPER